MPTPAQSAAVISNSLTAVAHLHSFFTGVALLLLLLFTPGMHISRVAPALPAVAAGRPRSSGSRRPAGAARTERLACRRGWP